MSNFRYFTDRTLADSEGKEKGKIRVLVPKDSNNAEVDYVCPFCGFGEHVVKEWKKPFSLKCAGCGKTIKISNLIKQFKREKKLQAGKA